MNRAPSEVLSWRLTGIARDNKSQISELTNARAYGGAALLYTPDAATTIDVVGSYTRDAPISPPGVPYALTQTGNGEGLRDEYYGEPAYNDSDRSMASFGVEISHEVGNGWTLGQGFRFEKFDWEYTGHYVTGLAADGLPMTRDANYQLENTTGLNSDTRPSNRLTTGTVTHDVLVGLDIRQYDADTTTQFFQVAPLDLPDPGAGALPADAPFYQSTIDVSQRQVGLYVQDELSSGAWHGLVGLRQDWSKQTGTSTVAGRIDQPDRALSGRAGLSYVMANGITPYASYSTSFNPEIGTNVDTGGPLRPNEARQWELGVKYQPAGINALFTAALYDMTQENVTEGLGNGVFRQIGEVESRGLELEATAEPAQQWDLRASYAYNDTEQAGGANDGAAMPNAPRHLARLWLDHDFLNGFCAGGGLRHIGSRTGVTGIDLDSVTSVDLGASYTRGNVEATVNLGNLTDEVYLSACGFFGCYHGEGRTVSAKVAYRW